MLQSLARFKCKFTCSAYVWISAASIHDTIEDQKMLVCMAYTYVCMVCAYVCMVYTYVCMVYTYVCLVYTYV